MTGTCMKNTNILVMMSNVIIAECIGRQHRQQQGSTSSQTMTQLIHAQQDNGPPKPEAE